LSFLSTLATLSFTITGIVAAARILGPGQYGRYVVLGFLIPLGSQVLDFGLSGAVVWHAGRGSLTRRVEMRSMISSYTTLQYIKIVPLGILSFLIGGRSSTALALAGVVAVATLAGPGALALNADRLFARQALIASILGATSAILVVLAALAYHDYRWSAVGYWAGQSIAYPIRLAFCPRDLRRAITIPGRLVLRASDYWFALSIWASGFFTQWIYGRSEILFFRKGRQETDRGRYGVTTAVAARATILSDALFATLDVSMLALSETAPERIHEALGRALRLSALLSITTAVIVMPGAAMLAGPIFGRQYGDLRVATIALLVASILQTFGTVSLVWVAVRRDRRSLLVPGALGVVVDVGLSLWLVPKVGLYGAVVANLLAVAVHQLLVLFLAFEVEARWTATRCLFFVGGALLVECAVTLAPWPGSALVRALEATVAGIIVVVWLAMILPKLAQPGDLRGLRVLRASRLRFAVDAILWIAGAQ
jgi:O-antigen/teichoic acid export membrane protein